MPNYQKAKQNKTNHHNNKNKDRKDQNFKARYNIVKLFEVNSMQLL